MKDERTNHKAKYPKEVCPPQDGVRLISGPVGAKYMGMGLSAFRRFGEEIGASRKIGGKRLYDRVVIDKYLDELKP